MEGGYTVWMGQPVILRVITGNLRVPLRGRLVSETSEIIRFRIADSWDVDIFKSMVVGIEHDNPVYVVNSGAAMNAIVSTDWNLESDSQVGMAVSTIEGVPMHEKFIALRDTMIVLSLQLSFRLIMLLRSWNY